MRKDIDGKINRLPLKYFSEHSYGDVLSRVTNDVDTIGQAFSNSLAAIVSAVAQFIGCLIMMYYTNWILGTTTVVTTARSGADGANHETLPALLHRPTEKPG